MEVRASRQIAAAPERVRRALTDPAELAVWSGAAAEVSDSVYRLRGESVPTGSLGGRLLENGDRGFRFEWPLGGWVSVVEIVLDPVTGEGGSSDQLTREGRTVGSGTGVGHAGAGCTRVTVHHRGIPEDALPARWPEQTWQCVWVLWLRLLQGWVERAAALPRFAFRPPFGAVVERSVEIDAPPERVWAALVDPVLRDRWLGVALGPELRREEGRLLVCVFAADQPATTVTWRIDPLPDGRTRVTVREEGLGWESIDNHLGWHDWLVALALEMGRPA
ncbi:SRPBCC family protein [Symbiobacterium thermophilum]|uniref:SRPBCC family protein n=1 Tax=Symbiobacterium thermophilum TaxID=2734 RepID=UPI0002F8A20A|nr:SRPBCC family protein [Symbiobacterium thermophilum]